MNVNGISDAQTYAHQHTYEVTNTTMSFDKNQYRELIRDVLIKADPVIPYSEAAVELLMLTCAQESHLGTYIEQIKGPAIGVFQMEPLTHNDIWINYVAYKPELKELLLKVLGEDTEPLWALKTNLEYQILMARIHYLRKPEGLPQDPENIQELAEYWKEHYNTRLGKGKPLEAVRNYLKFC